MGLILTTGIWFILSPLFFGLSGTALWLNLIIGALTIVLSLFATLGNSRFWATTVGGLLLFLAPLVFGFSGVALWLNLLVGAVLTVASVLAARDDAQTSSQPPMGHPSHH